MVPSYYAHYTKLNTIDIKIQHRRIAGGAWGCCSAPKLSEKSEIFRLSEILGCRSEIFYNISVQKRSLYYCKNVLIIFP